MKKLLAILGLVVFLAGCSNCGCPPASCDPCGYSCAGQQRNWGY